MLKKLLKVLKYWIRFPFRRYQKSRSGKIRIYNFRSKFTKPVYDKEFQRSEIVLGPVQQKVVNDLKANGIAIIDFRELFSENEYQKLKSFYRQFYDRPAVRHVLNNGSANIKDYIVMRTKFEKTVTQDEIMAEVGFSDKITGIVNSYLETFSRAMNFDLWYTRPSTAETRKHSQNWHRDPEDQRLVKIFLYLNDVDENAGPFSYIKGSHYAGPYGKLWPKAHPSIGIYPSEQEIYSTVKKEDVLVNTGKEATLIFCDTNGVHRGGFGTKERMLAYWVYAPHSTASLRRNTFIIKDKSKLTPVQKALIS